MKKRLLRHVGENCVSATESYDSCFTEKHAFLEKPVAVDGPAAGTFEPVVPETENSRTGSSTNRRVSITVNLE